MKNLIITVLVSLLLTSSCGIMQYGDIHSLREGMTPLEVERIMGRPVRTLSVNFAQGGKTEAYEYSARNYEHYAVEYFNERLTGYEFLFQDIPPQQVAPNYPPPPPPRPISPSYPPNRPNTPIENNRPPNRPDGNRPTPSRPDNNNRPSPSRPDNSRPVQGITRPTPKAEEIAKPADRPIEVKPTPRISAPIDTNQ